MNFSNLDLRLFSKSIFTQVVCVHTFEEFRPFVCLSKLNLCEKRFSALFKSILKLKLQ